MKWNNSDKNHVQISKHLPSWSIFFDRYYLLSHNIISISQSYLQYWYPSQLWHQWLTAGNEMSCTPSVQNIVTLVARQWYPWQLLLCSPQPGLWSLYSASPLSPSPHSSPTSQRLMGSVIFWFVGRESCQVPAVEHVLYQQFEFQQHFLQQNRAPSRA